MTKKEQGLYAPFCVLERNYIVNILVGCEESQTVCKEFRKRGHNSYSNDIVDCSGGHPE